MNKKLPFVPNETDALLYVIISVLLLMSVNQVLSKPQMLRDINQKEDSNFNDYTQVIFGAERLYCMSKGKDLYSSEVVNGLEETSMIKTFSSTGNLFLIGSTLYFTADDRTIAREFWKSNDTEVFREFLKKGNVCCQVDRSGGLYTEKVLSNRNCFSGELV
jgi:hypothetical protein